MSAPRFALFGALSFLALEGGLLWLLLGRGALGAAHLLLGSPWDPPAHLAAGGLIAGTLCVALAAVAFSGLLSTTLAVLLTESSSVSSRAALVAVEVGGALPGVVVGLVALRTLLPAFRFMGLGAGYGVAAAGLVLAFMILPTTTGLMVRALRALPEGWRLGGLALGVSPYENAMRLLLPAARRRLVAAQLVGFGRALGEATAVSLVIGNAGAFPPLLWTSSGAVAPTMLLESGGAPAKSAWGLALFALALALWLSATVVSLAARLLSS